MDILSKGSCIKEVEFTIFTESRKKLFKLKGKLEWKELTLYTAWEPFKTHVTISILMYMIYKGFCACKTICNLPCGIITEM